MPVKLQPEVLLVAALAVAVLLSYKQTTAFLKKRLHHVKTHPDVKSDPEAAGSRRGSRYSAGEGEVPAPKPLMITPEQVHNYDDRPWRPFRWPYHQTMSIFKLDINHWLDMDKYYIHYIEEKKRIWMKYGKQNIDWLPESEDACLELMEMVMDHMVARYPLLFTVLKHGTYDSKPGSGRIIKNEITHEILDMTYPLKEHPLLYVSKVAKEDFYVAQKNPEDGKHYLVAAAVPFPGGLFGIDEKLGKNLDVIHADVPYYKEKLQKSMERWFDRMKASDPVERASWYVTWDHKLKTNNVYQLPQHNPNSEADLKSTDPREFNVRVERQTLRRLPKSKAIIFTNHPIFYSIEEMKDEPMVPSLLRKILYEGPEDIVKYKNFAKFRDHIVEYLDGLVQRQIDHGLISADQPLKTLPTYPFAHWATTDFDHVNGWTNPSPAYTKSDNYTARAKQEIGEHD
ncbi:uncharacterized protein CANTADRAFT_46596 [Suhomyces tanzawaensis NRRL Y-17324]|uniref:HRQ family protein n=1 Tax=Suhomyces tanzawaensis NRRL Y-17324 TaxID=984487 RepID=A0A1E4SND7_9ASCO|nr:uncharacterized protein CANTADRAFT_46596 [Suhomyces tanzawaensis NRRL Y-17324]ODV81030.1 hypothetical protein CANTADRAFT_46596 [Suhomyces tanzawaensis NRRL Y-17324]